MKTPAGLAAVVHGRRRCGGGTLCAVRCDTVGVSETLALQAVSLMKAVVAKGADVLLLLPPRLIAKKGVMLGDGT